MTIFLVTGFAVATSNHQIKMFSSSNSLDLGDAETLMKIIVIVAALIWVVNLVFQLNKYRKGDIVLMIVVASVVGAIFALGLIVSQMVDRNKVLGFLSISDKWDPTLAFVLAAAVLPNVLTFYLIR